MKIALSSEKIVSFLGNVVPLYFDFPLNTNELIRADIKWSVSGDAVALKEFCGDEKENFNNGVLLVMKKAGRACVSATYNGEEHLCELEVLEQKSFSEECQLNYYLADMHDHTFYTHNHEECYARQSEFQIDYINQLKDEALMDASVISDHAGVLNDKDFFRGFVADEKSEPKDVVILPGAESEISHVVTDRFGVKRRLSGEIVTLNAENYVPKKSWQEFEDAFSKTPEPIGIFAHPNITGFSTPGIWNFDFSHHNTEEMLRIMRGIELGSGEDKDECLIYEYAYSEALDAGFRVSPTCASDSHGPIWGYHKIPGKTIIKAPEKSKEAFIWALRNNNFYATETGNVKLHYTVNGKSAPCELESCDKYKFKVSLSSFKEDKSTEPRVCKVISDGGITVKTLENIGSEFEFEIESCTAHYFYLRLSDSEGRRTWSMPVFTGRRLERKEELTITPISSEKFTAYDRISGKDARSVIDGDLNNFWLGDTASASIVIDMGEMKRISALGFCQRIVVHNLKDDWSSSDYTQSFAFEYEIYTSVDGEKFEKCRSGVLRTFGSEEIIELPKTEARYVVFEVKSTVGSYSGFKKYENAPVSIGNIAVFE